MDCPQILTTPKIRRKNRLSEDEKQCSSLDRYKKPLDHESGPQISQKQP